MAAEKLKDQIKSKPALAGGTASQRKLDAAQNPCRGVIKDRMPDYC
jgi:hypothetical protein